MLTVVSTVIKVSILREHLYKCDQSFFELLCFSAVKYIVKSTRQFIAAKGVPEAACPHQRWANRNYSFSFIHLKRVRICAEQLKDDKMIYLCDIKTCRLFPRQHFTYWAFSGLVTKLAIHTLIHLLVCQSSETVCSFTRKSCNRFERTC